MERALSWLTPGGHLVVLDSFLDAGGAAARWTIRAKARWVGADPTAIALADLLERLQDPQVQHFHGGSYTLVAGPRSGDTW